MTYDQGSPTPSPASKSGSEANLVDLEPSPLKVFPAKYRAWFDEPHTGYKSYLTYEEAAAHPGVVRIDKITHDILWFHDMERWEKEEGKP